MMALQGHRRVSHKDGYYRKIFHQGGEGQRWSCKNGVECEVIHRCSSSHPSFHLPPMMRNINHFCFFNGIYVLVLALSLLRKGTEEPDQQIYKIQILSQFEIKDQMIGQITQIRRWVKY